MRIELKNLRTINEHFAIADFHDMFAIAHRLNEAHVARLNEMQREYEAKSPELVDDIMDDLFWYGYLESFVIWHFALCRLQSILEGYISHNILKFPSKKGGINLKLRLLIKKGFSIQADDIKAIKEWARIRNTLTHNPPSIYSNGILQATDVEEYLKLCVKVATDLESQLEASNKV